MTESLSTSKGLEMRPHHYEGAMRIVGMALSGWDHVKDGAEVEPMEVMEMFFDASNQVISSTSSAAKAQIEAKWAENENYQKIFGLLSQKYQNLQRMASEDQDIDPDRDLINQGHAQMYHGIKEAYDKDSEGTIIFINGFDFVCDKCISDNNKKPPCLLMELIHSEEDPKMLIDNEVRKAHGWELNKPYKIKEILQIFYVEATRRKMFAFLEDQGSDQDFLSEFHSDVKQSKIN